MANFEGIVKKDAGNLLGPLTVLNGDRTPLLNILGGLSSYKPTGNFEYVMMNTAALDSALTSAVSEDAVNNGTSAVRSFGQDQFTNYTQVMDRIVKVSGEKAAQMTAISGLAVTDADMAYKAAYQFQVEMALKQMAANFEADLFVGAGFKSTNSNVATTTRGLITAVKAATTTATDAGTAAALTKTHIRDTMKKMAKAGAPMDQLVLFADYDHIDAINTLYEVPQSAAPGSVMVAGQAYEAIQTPFGKCAIVGDKYMPADAVVIADVAHLSLRGQERPGKGAVYINELAKTGDADAYQIVARLGLDYELPTYHGVIYDIV